MAELSELSRRSGHDGGEIVLDDSNIKGGTLRRSGSRRFNKSSRVSHYLSIQGVTKNIFLPIICCDLVFVCERRTDIDCKSLHSFKEYNDLQPNYSSNFYMSHIIHTYIKSPMHIKILCIMIFIIEFIE